MLACLSPNGINRHDGAAPPDRLFVATADGVSVLERAGPGGAWRRAASGLAGVHAATLAELPGGAGIFAGTHGDGVFFSADAGRHWEPRNAGLTLTDVYSVSAVAQDGGVTIYAGTQPAALFRSRDLGRSWSELPALRQVPGTEYWTFPSPPRVAHTKMIAFDPHDRNRFYVAIEQGALLRTEDGGASWRELASYSRPDDHYYRDVHQLLMIPSRPERLFMSSGIGLYKSLDAGASWTRLTDEKFRLGYPDHLALSPDERVLFMAGSRFEPGEWRRNPVADACVVRSGDGGQTWSSDCAGLNVAPGANIEAMSIACYPGGYTLFVGDTDGAVHASEDGGESWSRIADALAPVSKGNHAALLRGAAGRGAAQ